MTLLLCTGKIICDTCSSCDIWTKYILLHVLDKLTLFGSATFVIFSFTTSFSLTEVKQNGTEAQQLVKKVAALILADIREGHFDKDFYPSADDVSGDGEQLLPPLLRLLVEKLIKLPVKQAAIGQAIVQGEMHRGCLMPLIFATALDVDKSGNRQLHDKMARMGFSVSYDETRRFKHSVVQTLPFSDDEDIQQQYTETSVTQYVAANFD